MFNTRILSFASVVSLLLTSCSVGPDYQKPAMELPTSFKENAGWKLAQPLDIAPRGEWWQAYCDADLNDLEAQLLINNQTLRASEAAVRQAQAVLSASRSAFFPTIDLSADSARQSSGGAGRSANSYSASVAANWELDIWGRIRRTVESDQAAAAATEADLAAATLSVQAALASNYLNLRVADEQKRYLADTVTAYSKSLQLTQDLYQSGINTRSDYLQAKVQLESAQAQLVNVDVQRTAYEHAIAMLIGKAPSDFAIKPVLSVPHTPKPPEALPSVLLLRRPDVAAAERRAAAANASIGIAEAAFYPDFTLQASVGFASNAASHWFTEPNRVWTIGPGVVLPLFDAGLRRAQTAQAIAAYDQAAANYRQAVLTAWQDVEDQMAAVTILRNEQLIRYAAVADAHDTTALITSQYKEGITSYLNVATAQTTELSNALSALAVKRDRLNASVNLIKALGGGWDGLPQLPR